MDRFIKLNIANCGSAVCIRISAITAVVDSLMDSSAVDVMLESGHAFRIEHMGGAQSFLRELGEKLK